jgi:hypothetical protein
MFTHSQIHIHFLLFSDVYVWFLRFYQVFGIKDNIYHPTCFGINKNNKHEDMAITVTMVSVNQDYRCRPNLASYKLKMNRVSILVKQVCVQGQAKLFLLAS